MPRPHFAVHRTILVVDVEAFSSSKRTNLHRLAVRDGLYQALRRAFRASGIPWALCRTEDRGDGVLLLAPARLPKVPFAATLPGKLAEALRQHNAMHSEQELIRLRMALHAGEVSYDRHGVAAAAVNLAFRLLDAPALKDALAGSPGVLALVTSSWFFDDVIRHTATAGPASYRPIQVTVKETSTIAWIALPDCPYPPDEKSVEIPSAACDWAVPRQLPVHTPHFVGRIGELAALTDLLDRAIGQRRQEGIYGSAGTVVISAIGGTAGIGKTALALQWAHQVADRFPDGQLYVNLRGFDPAGSPVRPAEAIHGFLNALGVEQTRIPLEPDAQAALYRSLLAGRRFLVLLDNARDAEQVRPLLPGSKTCLVLVTSRSQLNSLAAREGARLLSLDLLNAAEARELLTRHLGLERVLREPAATDELIELCARLPLALSIAAARAAAQPTFPLAELVAELRDASQRLDTLDAGDPDTNVRAVFSCSYRNLAAPAARMFRMLSVHPGPAISSSAAASLAGVPLIQARQALAELTRAHLVTERTPGRFAFHDLLRIYAAQQAVSVETGTEHHAAVRRMLDYYLHSGQAAIRWLYSARDTYRLIAPDPQITTEDPPGREQALAWCEAEQQVFPAIVTKAAASGFDAHAWQIAWVVTAYFNRQGHLPGWVGTLHIALAGAKRSRDRPGQALASHELGYAYLRLGAYDEARTYLRHALDLNRQLGDRKHQAHNHLELSQLDRCQGHINDALSHARESVSLCLAAGLRVWQAYARALEGRCLAQLGECDQALACTIEAIAMHRELGEWGDKYGEVEMLRSLADIYYHLGNHPQAIRYQRQALELNRQLGDHYTEADILTLLGNTYLAVGQPETARDAWRQALAILEDLHHPEAMQVRAKVDGDGEAGQPEPGPLPFVSVTRDPHTRGPVPGDTADA